ncbi:MAG: hypothetical protein ACO20H_08125 [Bacteriovoracaceae bacterium]
MKKNFIILSLCLIFSGQIFAKGDYHLVKIISEPENNKIHNFLLNLDENKDINSIVRTSGRDRQEIEMDILQQGDFVLLSQSGRDVIILQCPRCDSVYGGELGIKYLRNGLNMKYRTLKLTLRRNYDDWGLFHGETKVKSLRIKTRKVLGQVIGIRKILINK